MPTADSKSKKEGAFCVWEQEEIKTLLSETVNTEVKTTLADIFIKHYGVEENGNVAASKVHIYIFINVVCYFVLKYKSKYQKVAVLLILRSNISTKDPSSERNVPYFSVIPVMTLFYNMAFS